jgi:hypothetical protein
LIDSTPNLEYAVSSLGTKVRSFELAWWEPWGTAREVSRTLLLCFPRCQWKNLWSWNCLRGFRRVMLSMIQQIFVDSK